MAKKLFLGSIIGCLGAGYLFSAASTGAAVTTYTDRAAWKAAVANIANEDFESDKLGDHPTPFTTAGGSTVTALGASPIQIQVSDSGLVNGSRDLHFRDFNAGIMFAIASSSNAFGFNYDTANESWVLEAGGTSTTLLAETKGFIGYVSASGPLASFVLRGAAGAQGGISIDNLGRAREDSFSLKRQKDGFTAQLVSNQRTMLIEFHRQRDHAQIDIREAKLGALVHMDISPEASSFVPKTKEDLQNAGKLVLGRGFLSAKPQDQALLLTLLSRSSTRIARELQGVEPEPTLTAIQAIPKFVGDRLEHDQVNNKQEIIVIGPNNGRCQGACGPGCNWCLCSSRWCACEVNLFCLAHDACCGAWGDFFNCFPCSFDPWVLF
jgi:hypothetical protein